MAIGFSVKDPDWLCLSHLLFSQPVTVSRKPGSLINQLVVPTHLYDSGREALWSMLLLRENTIEGSVVRRHGVISKENKYKNKKPESKSHVKVISQLMLMTRYQTRLNKHYLLSSIKVHNLKLLTQCCASQIQVEDHINTCVNTEQIHTYTKKCMSYLFGCTCVALV